MDDKFKTFVTSIGVLCEVWTMTYNNFIKQGLKHDDALVHTQGFVGVLITNGMQNND